ncbi:hypothetical protein CEV31_0051 [Brucella thiophenivorans]|uniref:Uncharacterized protein n=1 Tax=Brucella thiophenivorans TaxID=571255 RepID=A0A256G762_9HYPH|nr:hypothetical protein CEV31_0051 [Brucella thiophenivorans]
MASGLSSLYLGKLVTSVINTKGGQFTEIRINAILKELKMLW